jgi:hypothetical protein
LSDLSQNIEGRVREKIEIVCLPQHVIKHQLLDTSSIPAQNSFHISNKE